MKEMEQIKMFLVAKEWGWDVSFFLLHLTFVILFCNSSKFAVLVQLWTSPYLHTYIPVSKTILSVNTDVY